MEHGALRSGGEPLPGVSQVAMQGAAFAAKGHRRDVLAGRPRGRFHYFDKGIMATVGRSRAVAQPFGMDLSGFLAWMAWLLVHVWYLIGFRNRVIVMFEWFWAYATYKRGARLITVGGRAGEGRLNGRGGSSRRDYQPHVSSLI